MRLGYGRRGTARRRDAGRQNLVGWLAAASLLLHGWLPIVIQVHLAAAEAGGHGHHAATAAAPAPRAGERPECPLFHSAICLCAVFVKLLPAPGSPMPGATLAARDRQSRFPASRPSRPRPALLFDARAPPSSG